MAKAAFHIVRRGLGLAFVLCALGGCQSASPASSTPIVQAAATLPAASDLCPPQPVAAVEAWVNPPVGWLPDPLRVDSKHAHAVWISPSKDTAYGVVLMHLPLPVGNELVLRGFLNQLRETDGEATLIFKEQDSSLPGLRFVADSGTYRLRVNLITRGWESWAVYSGTYRKHPENPAELELANKARDHTHVTLAPPAAPAK